MYKYISIIVIAIAIMTAFFLQVDSKNPAAKNEEDIDLSKSPIKKERILEDLYNTLATAEKYGAIIVPENPEEFEITKLIVYSYSYPAINLNGDIMGPSAEYTEVDYSTVHYSTFVVFVDNINEVGQSLSMEYIKENKEGYSLEYVLKGGASPYTEQGYSIPIVDTEDKERNA